MKEFGCEIASPQAVVKLLITTLPMNLNKLDPTLHCKNFSFFSALFIPLPPNFSAKETGTH